MSYGQSPVRASRVLIVVVMLIAPLAGPGSLAITIVTAGTLTAYEGLHRIMVYGMFAVLFCVELLYGLDVGVLSLSYLAAVLVLALVRRVVTIAPWTASGGWHVSDGLRVLIVACGMYACMTASSIIIGSALYGYDEVLARLRIMFFSQSIAWIPIASGIVLVLLRRIDEPFRRRIVFGA